MCKKPIVFREGHTHRIFPGLCTAKTFNSVATVLPSALQTTATTSKQPLEFQLLSSKQKRRIAEFQPIEFQPNTLTTSTNLKLTDLHRAKTTNEKGGCRCGCQASQSHISKKSTNGIVDCEASSRQWIRNVFVS